MRVGGTQVHFEIIVLLSFAVTSSTECYWQPTECYWQRREVFFERPESDGGGQIRALLLYNGPESDLRDEGLQ